MSSRAGWEGCWFTESTNWLFTVRLCDRTGSYLGDLNTPVQQPLSPNVVPVVSNVVQQAAVLHQLSHELDRRRQADPQQTTHMRVIHARHHIRLLHTHTNTCVSVETCPIKEATNNKRRRNSNNKLKESYIQDFFVGFRWCGLSENFDGHWDPHVLSFRDPQTLITSIMFNTVLQ